MPQLFQASTLETRQKKDLLIATHDAETASPVWTGRPSRKACAYTTTGSGNFQLALTTDSQALLLVCLLTLAPDCVVALPQPFGLVLLGVHVIRGCLPLRWQGLLRRRLLTRSSLMPATRQYTSPVSLPSPSSSGRFSTP